MAGTTLTFRTDNHVKKQAMNLFKRLGMDVSTALNVFLRQAIANDGFPFPITRAQLADLTPNLREAHRLAHDPHAKTYANFKDLIADLDNDDDQ